MLVQEVAKTYAHALFMSTQDKGLVDKAYEQFSDLKKYLAGEDRLLSFLAAPQVPDKAKEELMRDAFAKYLEPLFVEFLVVLIEKNRIRYLPEIIDEFDRMVEAAKGIGRVTVITATGLDDAQRSRLADKLVRRTGFKIILEEKVDREILGGMIVIMHNRIIDGSVRHSLRLVEEQLAEVRVH